MNVVEVRDLSFRYSNSKDYTLKNISFSLKRDEALLIAGPTGSGKSTLGYILSGIAQSYLDGELEGSVKVFGRTIKKLEDTRGLIGYVFQSFENQLLSFTVIDELALAAINSGLSEREVIDNIYKISDLLNMRNLLKRYVFNLSSGEMQKVAIGSMIVLKPKILILDEPLSQLDNTSVKNLLTILNQLKDSGITIIIIEHRIRKILPIVDKVLILEAGEEIFFGDKRDAINTFERLRLRIDKISWHKHKKPSDKTIIKCEDIWISRSGIFGVVKGVSFEVKEGEIVLFYGPNGAGKTSLSLFLTGIIDKVKGHAQINGKISIVFQNPDYNIVYDTVFDEVYKPALNSGLTREEAKIFANLLLEKFNLSKYRSKHPKLLSKGEKMRLAIASALASKPNILILDEPTFGQDYQGILGILEMLAFFRDKWGLSIIINTNDEELMEAVGDRVYVIDKGEIIKVIKRGRDEF